jgi:hypothetical protein
MFHISELKKVLSQYFGWNQSRVSCLAQLLQALFCVKTVNLAQAATAFQSSAKEASSYRRIRRFFGSFAIDLTLIVVVVLNVFSLEGRFILIIDRTNWKWGKKDINILMLSVAYLGIGIPLFWMVLEGAGTSSTPIRITLLKRVLDRFGADRIEALVADREFIGEAWFRFLIDEKVPFFIRVKDGLLASGIRYDYPVPLRELWKYRRRRKEIVNYPIAMKNSLFYISICQRKNAKEPMMVVSNIKHTDPFGMYRRRWEIETLFACLKTRGFRLEDTHMTDPIRIDKLIFVLAIAFCWAYRTGIIEARQNPISIKTHRRRSMSFFRLGFNLIRSAVFAIAREVDQFISALKILSGLKSEVIWI